MPSKKYRAARNDCALLAMRRSPGLYRYNRIRSRTAEGQSQQLKDKTHQTIANRRQPWTYNTHRRRAQDRGVPDGGWQVTEKAVGMCVSCPHTHRLVYHRQRYATLRETPRPCYSPFELLPLLRGIAMPETSNYRQQHRANAAV